MNTTRETDLLAITRATKKLEYWQELSDAGKVTIIGAEDGLEYDVLERIEYWAKQVTKYRARIEKHISDFEKIKDPFQFLAWVSSIIDTIKLIINSLTK